jgi:hypothetical protein
LFGLSFKDNKNPIQVHITALSQVPFSFRKVEKMKKHVMGNEKSLFLAPMKRRRGIGVCHDPDSALLRVTYNLFC